MMSGYLSKQGLLGTLATSRIAEVCITDINRGRNRTPHKGAVRILFRLLSKSVIASVHTG